MDRNSNLLKLFFFFSPFSSPISHWLFTIFIYQTFEIQEFANANIRLCYSVNISILIFHTYSRSVRNKLKLNETWIKQNTNRKSNRKHFIVVLYISNETTIGHWDQGSSKKFRTIQLNSFDGAQFSTQKLGIECPMRSSRFSRKFFMHYVKWQMGAHHLESFFWFCTFRETYAQCHRFVVYCLLESWSKRRKLHVTPTQNNVSLSVLFNYARL